MSSLKDFVSIKDKREFERVYKKASKVWHSDSFVLFYLKGDEKKVAFVASKKVGKAVSRNRAKRLLRALFLNEIEKYKTGSYILIAKNNILKKEFQYLRKNWQKALNSCKLYYTE